MLMLGLALAGLAGFYGQAFAQAGVTSSTAGEAVWEKT